MSDTYSLTLRFEPGEVDIPTLVNGSDAMRYRREVELVHTVVEAMAGAMELYNPNRVLETVDGDRWTPGGRLGSGCQPMIPLVFGEQYVEIPIGYKLYRPGVADGPIFASEEGPYIGAATLDAQRVLVRGVEHLEISVDGRERPVWVDFTITTEFACASDWQAVAHVARLEIRDLDEIEGLPNEEIDRILGEYFGCTAATPA